MKPLLFLTFSQFKNGVVRALTSPKRLIGLLFFLGYYFWFFVTPAFRSGGAGRMGLPAEMSGVLELPPLQVIEALLFALFALLSFFMLLGATAQQAAFKPADVDVLFPTPISPKVVLLFRIVRDYLLTLVVPFLIALFGIRPLKLGWESLFKNFPEGAYGGMALRALYLGWILMAMCWVAITYAVSLSINRSERKSDRTKRILNWSIFLATAAVFVHLFFDLRDVASVSDAVQAAQHWVPRVFFFTASLASLMTIAPLTGQWALGLAGFLGLVGILFVSIRVALRQSDWMYDQAAVRGFDGANMKELQRKGDMYAVAAEYARKGKIKVRGGKWVRRWSPKGPMALLWKEYFLTVRGMMGMLFGLSIAGIASILVPSVAPFENESERIGILFFLQGIMLTSTIFPLGQIGYIEVLRRVDLLKPLPFTMFQTSFVEVAGRAAISVAASILVSLGVTVLRPELAGPCLVATMLVVGLSLLISATIWLVTVLFPDTDDHTQRQFRGFVTMIAVAVLGGVPVTMFLLAWLGIRWPMAAGALVANVAAIPMAIGVCAVAGKLYEAYNPSE